MSVYGALFVGSGKFWKRQRATARTAAFLAAALMVVPAGASSAQDTKVYDQKLLRLAEILGAVHYLRQLCGANEGQLWREQMKALIEAEGAASALRKAKLIRSFNLGYRGYSRTYNSCTATAQTAIARFLKEGTEIAEGLVKKAF